MDKNFGLEFKYGHRHHSVIVKASDLESALARGRQVLRESGMNPDLASFERSFNVADVRETTRFSTDSDR